MPRMVRGVFPSRPRRRDVLLASLAALAPLPSFAAGVCTPRELAQRFAAAVPERLQLPPWEDRIYAALAEGELAEAGRELARPQYLLVVDSCPVVQAAFLFWRLLPSRYELVGAAPASTGSAQRPGCLATPCGVFPQAGAGDARRASGERVYDFGTHRVRQASGRYAPLHLQAHAAQGESRALLGTAQSDGRVLLPASVVAFLDAYGVLDGEHGQARTPEGESVPFAGQLLVVTDSDRDERPDWASA